TELRDDVVGNLLVEVLVEVRAMDSSVAVATAAATPATLTFRGTRCQCRITRCQGRITRCQGRSVTGCSPPVATGPRFCSPRTRRRIVDRKFNFRPSRLGLGCWSFRKRSAAAGGALLYEQPSLGRVQVEIAVLANGFRVHQWVDFGLPQLKEATRQSA